MEGCIRARLVSLFIPSLPLSLPPSLGVHPLTFKWEDVRWLSSFAPCFTHSPLLPSLPLPSLPPSLPRGGPVDL
jgi:hypothetical protein